MVITKDEAEFIAQRVGEIVRNKPNFNFSIGVVLPTSAAHNYWENTMFVVQEQVCSTGGTPSVNVQIT